MNLVVMRIPPNPAGHGGSQRAWYLLEGLLAQGPLDFVLIHRASDKDCVETSLAPVAERVASVTRIEIPEWEPTTELPQVMRWLPKRVHAGWVDIARLRSFEAPKLSAGALERIAEQLPRRDYDLVFAGRIPSATIVDALIERGLLRTRRKVVDFDDIMSRFRAREIEARGAVMGGQWRMVQRYDSRYIQSAEDRIASDWNATSLCNDEDVALIKQRAPGGKVVKVPNVISRPLLPEREADGTCRVLFVGSLAHGPNAQGLEWFITEVWPSVQAKVPHARLTVVGMFPYDRLRNMLDEHGATLAANVPSVEPYYAEADMVVSPILFGGGTRIKILEAMAYGRAVVSTTIGAEGLDIVPGEHAMIADAPEDFADAIATLANDPARRRQLAAAGRALQERAFGPPAIAHALEEMLQADA